MIAEYGRLMFHLALATIIISSILVPVLPVIGLPVPGELIRYSGILGLITGRVDLGTLMNFGETLGFGIGGLFLLGGLLSLFRAGSSQLTQALSLKTLATYLALWVPVANGIDVILFSFGRLLAILLPGPLAAETITLVQAVDGFTKFSVIYYLLVRAFGLPNE